MEEELFIKTLEVPFQCCGYRCEDDDNPIKIFARNMTKIIQKKLDECNTSYQFHEINKLVVVGESKSVKRFLRWYNLQVIKLKCKKLI